MINALNNALTRLFDGLLWPFRGLAPIWGLAAISLVSGVLMVWIFGLVSNQAAIGRVKNRIAGNLIGVRLFQSNVGVVFRLQGRILLDTLVYMKHSLTPMLVMFIPVALILIQLDLRYSARPLKSGERAVVKAKVRDARTLREKIALEAPKGVDVETPGVRIESEREIAWRIRANEPGSYSLLVRASDESVEKSLTVSDAPGAVPSLRAGSGAFPLLLHPGEPPIPSDSKITAIKVNYPAQVLRVFHWKVNWLVLFLVLSIAFGFMVKGFLGVQV